MRRILLLLPLLMSATHAGAEMYSWKDAEGHVHFGDKPPTGNAQNAHQIEERKAYSPGTDAQVKQVYERTNRLFDAKDKMQREARQKEESLARDKAERDSACQEARTRLTQLHGHIYFVDDQGREIKDGEPERQKNLQETQAWIAQNCP